MGEFDAAAFLDRDPWRADAACRGMDPELFHPHRMDVDGYRIAKSVCRECDVQAECLTYAMNVGEELGVWGGLSEAERRRAIGRNVPRQMLVGVKR